MLHISDALNICSKNIKQFDYILLVLSKYSMFYKGVLKFSIKLSMFYKG